MTQTQKAIKGMLAFFESGNGVPVDKAVIRADCAEVAALRAASEALDKGVKDLLKRRVLPALQAENEVSPADVGNFVASRTGGTYYKNRLDNGDAELWVNTSVERLGYAIREALGPLTTAKVEIAKVGQLRPNIAAAPSDDTLYLLRRLLSNQHTLTGTEFREELTKIVEDAYSARQEQ